jgi:hypothetical protein
MNIINLYKAMHTMALVRPTSPRRTAASTRTACASGRSPVHALHGKLVSGMLAAARGPWMRSRQSAARPRQGSHSGPFSQAVWAALRTRIFRKTTAQLLQRQSGTELGISIWREVQAMLYIMIFAWSVICDTYQNAPDLHTREQHAHDPVKLCGRQRKCALNGGMLLMRVVKFAGGEAASKCVGGGWGVCVCLWYDIIKCYIMPRVRS